MPITIDSVRCFAVKHLGRLLPGGFRGRFFLAGGCFKSLIHGKEPNDLDLWPASPEDRALLLDSLLSQGSVVVANTQFNTILKNPAFPFRVEVTIKCPSSIEESVADFDIQLACVAAEYSNGSVEGVYIHAGVADCIFHREVRAVTRLLPMRYSLRTLERLDRYGKELGFSVCQQSRRRVWDIYTAASEEERNDLLHAAGLRREDVPTYAAIQRVFLDGRPSEPCRPFTNEELDALRISFGSAQSRSDTTGTPPTAVFVVGLPASGKGTVLEEILWNLGLSVETMANLDMDHIRSFHGQFTQHIRGVPCAADGRFEIYKDLISWFNEGSGAEQILYKGNTSIVHDLLSRKCDFIVPVHSMASLDFIKYVSSDRYGYVPYLIEIRVSLEVAIERASIRAKVTGRYTPLEYIKQSACLMAEFLPAFKEFVEGQKGGVVVSYDNSRSGGGGLGPPPRVSP